MKNFDIYFSDHFTQFDILIRSLVFRDSFYAANQLLLDARVSTSVESNNLVTEHGDAIMIGDVKILV